MIAQTMAGIALVKGAVDGIKSMIGTANDVSEIAGYIDKLFEGEKQVQQIRNKKSGVNSFGDIGGVASEVIDARLAAEKLQEVATMVDMRFGHGTWKSIVDERARRIQEQKAKEAELRRLQFKKAKELEELFQSIMLAVAVATVSIALIVAVFMYT